MSKGLLVVCMTVLGVMAHAEEKKEDPRQIEHDALLKTLLALNGQGKYADAIPLGEKCAELTKAINGDQSTEYANSLAWIGHLHNNSGQFAKTIPVLTSCLEIYHKHMRRDNPDIGNVMNGATTAMNNLALAHKALGHFKEAEPLFQTCLVVREKQYGPNHGEVALTLNNLASLYSDQGQFEKAEPLYVRSLEIYEKQPEVNSLQVSLGLNNLAHLYKSMGLYEKAEPLALRSVQIREKQFGPDHPEVAFALANLAALYNNMGQYAKSQPILIRSLAIYEKQPGGLPYNAVAPLNNLGELYAATGKYVKAESLYQQCLTISESQFGAEHLNVAVGVNNLAVLYWKMGQLDKAMSYCQRCLKIQEKFLEPDHPSIALSLNNLGQMHQEFGQPEKAEPYFLRSLAIYEKKFGTGSREVALSLNNLGMLYDKLGQPAKAESMFKRSLVINEKQLGPDHPDVALGLNNLAMVLADAGNVAEAEPLFSRSLAIYEKLGPDHPDAAQSMTNFGLMYSSVSDWKNALPHQDLALRIKRRFVANVLPSLSESEQNAFLKELQRTNIALSYAFHAGELPALVNSTAEWLLNSKGILSEARADRVRVLRQSSNPAVTDLGQNLMAARSQLSQANISTPKAGQEAERYQRLKVLQQQEQAISRQLAQALGTEIRNDPWVGLDEFRAAMPPGSVFVDIARVEEYDFGAKGKQNKYLSEHYVAWLIFSPGAPQGVVIVKLGKADEIDLAVKGFRAAAEKMKSIEAGERLAAAAAQVLKPLEAKIGACERWLLSPDGALWLLPWAALPTGDGKPAVHAHTIQYLISGRELVAPGYKVQTSPPAIFADPDFDLGTAIAAKPAGQSKFVISRSASLKGMTVAPLPGTAREAEAIRSPLAAITQSTPVVWTRADANKANFFKLSCPKAVVLSTHGFFLEEGEKIKDPATGGMHAKPGAENPLLRCGLFLAGANNREHVAEGGDDGILSGLEIASADLRGTELVVLSACETGVGTVNIGEGVAGLRQSFELAGANTILATLWHVSDDSTVTLMTDFFKNLAAGQTKPTALRNAQLNLIKAMEEAGKPAHPYLWAGFTITGR